jgi:hypothetical protein
MAQRRGLAPRSNVEPKEAGHDRTP